MPDSISLFSDNSAVQGVLDSLPNMYYMLDLNGRFIRWNQKFVEVTGYSAAEIRQLNALDLFAAADKVIVGARIRRVFESGASDVEAALISRDGRSTPYFFTGKRVIIHGKQYLSGIGFDMSILKQYDIIMGFGLFNIRTRLESVGGHLDIESVPGEGTQVTMLVPLY